MSIISIRIIAVINTMSTSQSINAHLLKHQTVNYYINGLIHVIAKLISLDLAVNNLRQWA